MGVPKRKTSKMRLRTRRAANAWKSPGLYVDPKTGNRHHGHCVDAKTGTYEKKFVLMEVRGEKEWVCRLIDFTYNFLNSERLINIPDREELS